MDFDTSGRVFIEGDNLEVAKLLSKAYLARVKVIYLDPSYNTDATSFTNPSWVEADVLSTGSTRTAPIASV